MRRLTLTFSIVAIAGIALGVAAQQRTATVAAQQKMATPGPAKVVVYKSPT